MTELTSYKFACVIARILDEKIASNISILNISNVSSFADYFVICSAQTSTQVKALTENLSEKICIQKEPALSKLKKTGYNKEEFAKLFIYFKLGVKPKIFSALS